MTPDADVLLYSAKNVGVPATLAMTREFGIGGSELELVQVAHGLAERGHKVVVAMDLEEDQLGEQEGVTYTSLENLPKYVRSLYLQRWSEKPEEVWADNTIVRCNDGGAGYEVHNRLLSSGKATLVVNSNWHVTLYPFAKKKVVINPIIGEVPKVEKKKGQFIFASAPPKGLYESLKYWGNFVERAQAIRPVELLVIVPGFSGDMPDEFPVPHVRGIGAPTPVEYRRLVAESEGLFYVSRFSEVFGCVATIAETGGTRPHILCLRGIGGLRESLTDSRLVTSDPEAFERDFFAALQEPEQYAPRGDVVDRSASVIIPQWEDVLGLV